MKSENSLGLIKLFIEATSKEQMVLMQYKNNILNQTRFIYGDPMFIDGKWISWYFGEIDQAVVVEQAVEVLKENGSR